MFKKLLAVVAVVCAVLVLFHVDIGGLDGLRILGIGLGGARGRCLALEEKSARRARLDTWRDWQRSRK
jgi:hypothetical protein